MAPWPRVFEGDGEEPRVIDQGLEEDLEYARPPELAAWGTVEGVPWRIQASVTKPGAHGKWWEHGPVGPELDFLLGKDDAFGGGGANTRLNEGTHMTASIHFFGSHPAIVSWTGVVSDDVARLVVDPDDGDQREIEIRDGPPEFPRLFWFFPPRGAEGTVVVYAKDGSMLQSERLVDIEVPPDSNSGTSVNGFGYRADRPPPGWPADDTEYGPGEGPRHADDFHLHEAAFPLYALPPDLWDGFAGLSGSSTSGREVTQVRFGYFDEPGGSRRGLEIVNARLDRRPWDSSIREENVGIWSVDPFPGDDAVDFAGRFLTREQEAALQDERGLPTVGPTRVVAMDELEVDGSRVESYRREFRVLPQLRCIGLELPGVRVLVQGWDISFEELEGFARALERLELGNEVFGALTQAQVRSDRGFDELHRRHDAR